MQGCITICEIHNFVYNAHLKKWQEVSGEMMNELMETAKEMEAKIFDSSCCPVCNKLAADSLHHLYANRYWDSQYAELGTEAKVPYDSSDD